MKGCLIGSIARSLGRGAKGLAASALLVSSLALAVVLAPTPAQAQTTAPPVWLSAALVGDSTAPNGSAEGIGLRPDGQGGAWVSGTVEGSIEVGATVLRGQPTDIWVARIDGAGQWLLAVRAGGPGQDRAPGLATDAAGNAYLTGSFQDSIRFGALRLSAQGAARTNAFVAKISPTGQWLWATQAAGDAAGTALVVVPGTGEVVVVGSFGGVVTFGSNTLFTSTNRSVDRDVFVARLSATGQWLGAAKGGGNRQDVPTAVALDGQGGAVVTGTTASRTAAFGAFSVANVSVVDGLTGAGAIYADVFVARWQWPGNTWTWATGAGGAYDESAAAVAVGPNGRITVAGTYNGRRIDVASSVGFGPVSLMAGRASARPLYVAQLDPAGQWLNATSGADSAFAAVGGLGLDAAGEATVWGAFAGPVAHFGALTARALAVIAPGTQAQALTTAYVAHLASGAWTWTRTAGGGTGETVPGGGFLAPTTGDVLLTGRFTGASVFTATALRTSTSGAFVARLPAAAGPRSWSWATATNTGSSVRITDVGRDAQGNELVVGTFSGQPRLGALTLAPPTPAAALRVNNLFVAKRSPAGQWLWATPAAVITSFAIPPRLKVDPATGEAYIVGQFAGEGAFGALPLPSPGAPVTYGQRSSFFVARISAGGQWQWATAPAYAGQAQARGLALDPRGGLVVVGAFTDTLQLGATQLLSPGSYPGYFGAYDGFLARLSPFGQWLSAVRAGGVNYDFFTNVVVDARGEATITGLFSDSVAFDSAHIVLPPRSTFGNWSAVARLDAANVWQWVAPTLPVRAGSSSGLTALAIEPATGDVLVGGGVTDSVRFGNLLVYVAAPLYQGVADGIVGRYRPSTNQWIRVQRFGGASGANGVDGLYPDPATGDCYVTGTFSGALQLGPSALLADRDTRTALVARLSATSGWRWGLQTELALTSRLVSVQIVGPDQLLVTGFYGTGPVRMGATTLPAGWLPQSFEATIGPRSTTGLATEAAENSIGLTLYPNPAPGGAVTLTTAPATEPRMGQVFDALGRMRRTFACAAGATEVGLPVRGLPAGLYVVRLAGQSRRLVLE